MPNLAPLTEHGAPGVRYFSGVASYITTFNAADAPRNGCPMLLDPGRVGDRAEVRVNGQLAGTVWAAPYRLDIGKYAAGREQAGRPRRQSVSQPADRRCPARGAKVCLDRVPDVPGRRTAAPWRTDRAGDRFEVDGSRRADSLASRIPRSELRARARAIKAVYRRSGRLRAEFPQQRRCRQMPD